MTVLYELGALMADRGIEPRGVVHVGGHRGEELPVYRRLGFARIVLVEPNPTLAAMLREIPDVDVVEAACGAYTGRTDLHITENSKLSSIYRPISRPIARTVPVRVVRLAHVIDHRVNVAVVDAQGAELDVAAGAPLDRLDLLVMETRVRAKYAGAPLHDDAVGWMARAGWAVAAQWSHGGKHKLHDVAFVPERR